MLRANLLLCDDAFMLKLDRLEGDPMALPIYCHLMHDVLILLLKILAPKPRSQCLHLLEIEKLFTMLTALASCFTPARLTDNVSFLTLAYHQNTMNTVGRSFRGLHLPRRRSSLPLSARARLRHRIWLAFLLAHWHRAPFFAILVYFVKVHLHRKSSGSATWCRQPSDGLGRLGPVITKDKLRQIESFWNLAAGYCTSIFNAKEQTYVNRDPPPPTPRRNVRSWIHTNTYEKVIDYLTFRVKEQWVFNQKSTNISKEGWMRRCQSHSPAILLRFVILHYSWIRPMNSPSSRVAA